MKPKPRPHYKGRPRPMSLAADIQRQRLARLLLVGLNAEQIARRMNRKPQTIRYHIAQPELLTIVEQLQHEELKRVDRKIRALLLDAVTALSRQLKSPDWRARDSAIAQVFRLHGKFIDRLDVTGTLTGEVNHQHAHAVRFGMLTDEAMSNEQRRLARDLLTTFRATEPRKALSPIFSNGQEQSQDARASS